MHCEDVLNHYLLRNSRDPLPLSGATHLLHCKACRRAVKRMSRAENLRRSFLDTPPQNGDRMLNATMTAIYQLNARRRPAASQQPENTALLPWLAVGLFLIAGFIVLPLSDIGQRGLSQFGDSFSIPFALLCAGCIVAYFAVFLAKYLLFFTEKFLRNDLR